MIIIEDKYLQIKTRIIQTITKISIFIREIAWISIIHKTKIHSAKTIWKSINSLMKTARMIFCLYRTNKITKIIPMSAFFKVSSYLLFALSIYFGYEGITDLYAGLRELKVI